MFIDNLQQPKTCAPEERNVFREVDQFRSYGAESLMGPAVL
jgi:hypothetical protein